MACGNFFPLEQDRPHVKQTVHIKADARGEVMQIPSYLFVHAGKIIKGKGKPQCYTWPFNDK